MSDRPDYESEVVVIGTVTITGTVSVSGTVTVTGTVAISGTVTVTGSVTVSGTVSISGTVTVSGTVSISGTVTISGDVTVSAGVAITGPLDVSGNVKISGPVTVSGTVSISGTVTVSGTVSISGTVTVTGSVTVSGSVSISGTVTIQGTAGGTAVQIQGVAGGTAVAISGSVTVSGTVSISGTVTVSGSVTVSGTVSISGTVTVSGTVSISGTVTVSGDVTVSSGVAITGPLDVSGNVKISGSVTVSGTVSVSGTVTVSGSVSITGTVTVTGSVTVSGTVSISGTVTVSGTVSISGTVTITGSVSITGTVTISGAVTITSGAVTISTSGGTNIIVDKLTQGAYTENRTTLSNDNGVSTPTAPPDYDADPYCGKFFPRGARGYIELVSLYGYSTAGGTITLALSLYPGAGEIYTIDIPISAGVWNWYSANLRKMWNYDSMFIWWKVESGTCFLGRQAATPYDEYYSADNFATSYAVDYRLFIRATMKGETVGDIPVSGTLNTIEIPMTTSSLTRIDVIPTPGQTLDLIPTNYGIGVIKFQFKVISFGSTEAQMWVGIVVDGTTFEISMSQIRESCYGITNLAAGFLVIGSYDSVNLIWQLTLKGLKFLKNIRVYGRNAGSYNIEFVGIYIIEKQT